MSKIQRKFGNSKPNIILLFPDEWRWDCIGALDLVPPVQTPNLNQIAAKGVTFSNAYTCGPLCMPARASMMTGLYVHEHGQWDNDPTSSASSYSHVKRIRDDAKYHTALIGKAHLSGPLADWGFDETEVVNDAFGLWHDENNAWAGSLPIDKFYQFQAYMYYYDPRYNHKKPWGTKALDKPAPPPAPLTTHPPSHPYTGKYSLNTADRYDTFVGDEAAKWIRNYSHYKPFYLQVNFPGPHYPEDSTTEFRKKFDASQMGTGILKHPQLPISPLVKWSRDTLCKIKQMTDKQNMWMRKIYFANILMVDQGIGKILQALQDQQIDDNTWIFFSSDHGEMLGDHYLMYKLVFYESATKVPLIVRPPALPPSLVPTGDWVSDGMTDHLDLTASLLDVAGLTPIAPADHGKSLLPKVAAGPSGTYAQKGKKQVISEISVPGASAYKQLMLRTENYKPNQPEKYKLNVELTSPSTNPAEPYYAVKKAVELYDLVNDPQELNNRINDPAYNAVKTEMKNQIHTILQNAHTP